MAGIAYPRMSTLAFASKKAGRSTCCEGEYSVRLDTLCGQHRSSELLPRAAERDCRATRAFRVGLPSHFAMRRPPWGNGAAGPAAAATWDAGRAARGRRVREFERMRVRAGSWSFAGRCSCEGSVRPVQSEQEHIMCFCSHCSCRWLFWIRRTGSTPDLLGGESG